MQSLSVDVKVFIIQLMERNYKNRISATKAIENPWIKKQKNKFDLSQTKMVRAARNLLDYDVNL
jgi:hypothetical protein